MKGLNKRGQIATLQTLVIALLIIGIVLGIGFLLLEEFVGVIDDKAGTFTNATYETVSDNGVYSEYNSTNALIPCFNTFALSICINATEGTEISSGNYTTTAATGKLAYSGIAGGGYNTTDWNCTGTYLYGGAGCAGVESTIEGVEEIPQWLTIIVIIFIVGILLAIVFKVLPRVTGGRTSGGSGGVVAEI